MSGKIKSDKIKVWYADLDAPSIGLSQFWQTLSPDEQGRVKQLRRPLDQSRWTAARGHLRLLLGHALACSPSSLRFGYTAQGKPFLPSSPLCFSLSHCGPHALFALSSAGEIGIDVEEAHGGFDPLPLAARYFLPDEMARLCGLPPAPRRRAFFQAWTRREALGKALGLGVTGPAPALPVGWTCLDLPLTPSLCAAVAGEGQFSVRVEGFPPLSV